MPHYKDPAKEAARKERSYASSRMTKCGCGNVAGLGQTSCSRCREAAERAELARAREAWVDEQMAAGRG